MLSAAPQIPTPADEPVDRSLVEDRAESLAALFRSRVVAMPDRPAFIYAVPAADGTDEWLTVTWAETKGVVDRLAAGLVALGVGPEDRVAIASNTRYEWAIADLAVMCAGAATTTIYPSTMADDVAFIVSDSGAVVVVAENAVQVDKLRGIRGSVPAVRTVVVIDDSGVDTGGDGWVIPIAELDRLGAERLAAEPDVVDRRVAGTRHDQLATIIYTSGTTGRPKGVRLLHSAWTYEAAATEAIRILGPDDLQYLWLPLAHSFGKVLLTLPLQIGFPTAIDGRIDRIVDNLAVVRPTFMGAAPRIFEKAYGRIQLMMAEEGGVKERLFHWAEGVGHEVSLLREQGRAPSGLLAAKYALADRLVMTKIRDRFGGQVRFFISGSAALNQDVARWFDAMGLPIAEGYGLTETSAASFVNRLAAYRYGTVGWPFPGTEVLIAEDGEVLLRGPGVMEGYHNNPEATADSLDAEGWFHTGDIGELDADGYLRITERKKDLIKTSGGKYVAPQKVEAAIAANVPYISQAVAVGEGRKYVVALITLDPDSLRKWGANHGHADLSYAELSQRPEIHHSIERLMANANAHLERWETVKRFAILDHEFSVDDGGVTPNMKVRRNVVEQNYADVIDSLYDQEPGADS